MGIRLPWRRGRPGRVDGVPAALAWVDEYMAAVAQYVCVRTADNVLIKRPNRAQRLNAAGARLLAALLGGAPIARVLAEETGGDERRVRAIAHFLLAFRGFVDGTLDELTANPAVEVTPLPLNFSALPVLAEVAVTYRCNLACTFCYAGCNCTTNPTGDTREMSAAEVRRVLDRIREQGEVPSVSFTGGEPTLRPELPEFVAHAKSLGMRVNLITNGTTMGRRLTARLVAAGLDSAQVSLEGVDAATHERITRRPRSFARTLAAVERLRDAGVTVHTNTTINRDNLDECARMPDFVAERLGLERFSMNLLVPTGSAALEDGLVVGYAEIGEHLKRILDASRRAGVEFMWYSPTPMCLFNPVAHGLGNHGCSACDGLLSVAANGAVLPCASYDDPVGNLLDQDLAEIWGSVRARAYREKRHAPAGCRGCAEFAACNGACPLYWRHVGEGELEAARARGTTLAECAQ